MADIELPEKLQCLFWEKTPQGLPVRYRVLHGGRGGGKTWAAAIALLAKGLEKPIRVLCAREIQNSIQESVHRILADQIYRLGLESEYQVLDKAIRGRNGTEFYFEGIRHNISRVRSYEGIDVCWVEEAVNVPESSWRVLIPTIRKAGSEIWMTFNPELETDYTYVEWVKNSRPDAVVQQVNWRDNPWFTAEMRAEKDLLKSRNLDSYLNVWEGHCRLMLEGAIYAQELRDAQAEGRLSQSVPYDRSVPVDAFFDLGRSDLTAIWFGQKVGFQYRVINYYQGNQKAIGHYLKFLQRLEYTYGTIWLPHDAKAKTIGSELSVEEQTRNKGFRVRIVPNLKIADGINAARTIFPNCWFDPKRCEEGIQCLRRYRYDVDPNTKQFSKDPLHDQFSHGADAFRYLAVALKAPKVERKQSPVNWFIENLPEGLQWMR